VHARQQLDQTPSLRRGEPRESLRPDFVREVEDTGENRARLFGQHQAVCTPVTWVRPPLDLSIVLHSVDLPNQAHRLDFEQIGKARLVDPFVASDIAQHLALRPGETQKQLSALVETASKQPGNVVDEKTEAAIEIHGE
jgi:hypothetical protein